MRSAWSLGCIKWRFDGRTTCATSLQLPVRLYVASQEPGKVFSAAVSLDYADRSGAQVLLEQALREAGGDPTETHRAVVRRADGKLWKDALQKDPQRAEARVFCASSACFGDACSRTAISR